MKFIKLIILSLLITAASSLSAQDTKRSSGGYGKTLNIGLGVGYYGYMGHSSPALHLNYELDVAKNFTLAPFITVFSYEKRYYWGNPHYPYREYSYRQTVIPIGVKGSFYFDNLIGAAAAWDFYLAGSVGFAIVNTRWEEGYYGEEHISGGPGPLYVDLHVGTEYHFNSKLGMYLDLSSGISTIGLSRHF